MSSEQIEDIMSAINEMGINVVENEEATEDDDDERDKEPEPSAGEDEVDPLDDGGPRPAAATKKEPTDRTDDPVRMYLREMGAVELLSREGEIAIAKRIEAGRDTMIWGRRIAHYLRGDHRLVRRLERRPHAVARDHGSRGDALEGAHG